MAGNEFLQLLCMAAGMTIGLALASLVIGLLLALVFAVLESSRWKVVSIPASTLITVLRGLPEILVVLFIYFGSTQVLFLITDNYVDLSPFWCGAVALAIIFASYASQTLRGALKAISAGQWESGAALGMRPWHIFTRLILPQVWRHALPGLGNQWLVLLKDTALVSLIGVNELMRQAQTIATSTWQPFTWFAAAAVLYLVITLISQFLLQRLDRYVTRFERSAV